MSHIYQGLEGDDASSYKLMAIKVPKNEKDIDMNKEYASNRAKV